MKYWMTSRYKETEAYVQFELYRKLKNAGYDVRAEVIFKVEGFTEELVATKRQPTKKVRTVKPDLAIFKMNEPLLMIETKRPGKRQTNTIGKQWKRYNALGVPFIYKKETSIEDIIDILSKGKDE